MTIRGSLVKKAADQTAANYTGAGAMVAWDSEIYDFGGFHDNVTDNTKLIVPGAVNGNYGVVYATMALEDITANDSVAIAIYKNGSTNYRGGGLMISKVSHTGQANNAHWIHVSSAPIVLTTADYFELGMIVSTDTSITVKAHSNFGIQILDAWSTQLVLARKTSDQSGANYSTPTAVAWNGVDIYDTINAHDPSSNNTKLIIPSALNGKYVIVSANLVLQLVADNSNASCAITKGGSFTYDGFAGQSGVSGGTSTLAYPSCRTSPIVVATGDEFEMVAYCSDTSITLNELSSFGLRAVDS